MALWAKKKYLKFAKGFHGRVRNCANLSISKVQRSFQKAYTGRRLRLRQFRSDWIRTISSSLLQHKIRYNEFINFYNHSNINLDRKIMAQLAKTEPYSYKALIDQIKIQNNFIERKEQFSLMDGYKHDLLMDSKDIRQQDLKYKHKPIDLVVDNPHYEKMDQLNKQYARQVQQQEAAKNK